jgi:hypothetical protein
MKDRARQVRIFTPSFTAALLVTGLFTAGAAADLPPFSWVMEWNGRIKDAQTEARPPAESLPEEAVPGLGRMTLGALCEEYGFDAGKVTSGLKARGLSADSRRTVKENAEASGMGPHDYYDVIREVSRP